MISNRNTRQRVVTCLDCPTMAMAMPYPDLSNPRPIAAPRHRRVPVALFDDRLGRGSGQAATHGAAGPPALLPWPGGNHPGSLNQPTNEPTNQPHVEMTCHCIDCLYVVKSPKTKPHMLLPISSYMILYPPIFVGEINEFHPILKGPNQSRLKKSEESSKQQQPGWHQNQHLAELREPLKFCNEEDLAHRGNGLSTP